MVSVFLFGVLFTGYKTGFVEDVFRTHNEKGLADKLRFTVSLSIASATLDTQFQFLILNTGIEYKSVLNIGNFHFVLSNFFLIILIYQVVMCWLVICLAKVNSITIVELNLR